jgi:hypothetical protein
MLRIVETPRGRCTEIAVVGIDTGGGPPFTRADEIQPSPVSGTVSASAGDHISPRTTDYLE